jgi:hypothetical protein
MHGLSSFIQRVALILSRRGDRHHPSLIPASGAIQPRLKCDCEALTVDISQLKALGV